MGAAKGNRNWSTRVKVGRPLKFKTPGELWEAASAYFDYCDNNPWYKNELVRGGNGAGTIIQVPTARPYTIKGMLLFIGVAPNYWSLLKGKVSGEYSEMIEKIEMIIETQQFEGAVVGVFNPAIIARKLGLKDSPEIIYAPVNNGPTEVIFRDFSKR